MSKDTTIRGHNFFLKKNPERLDFRHTDFTENVSVSLFISYEEIMYFKICRYNGIWKFNRIIIFYHILAIIAKIFDTKDNLT